MNHYFYSGRQVGATITLAGAQETIHAMNQAIQMQATSIFGTNDARTVYAILTISDAKCEL